MNTFKTMAVALTLMLVAGTAFASGTGERPADVDPGRRLTEPSTDLTVSGELAFVDGHPVLMTSDGPVSISMPRGGLLADQLVEGMELTVTGEAIAALDNSPSGAEMHLFVESARANGEDVDLENLQPRGWSDDAVGQRAGGPQAGARVANQSQQFGQAYGQTARQTAGRPNAPSRATQRTPARGRR